MKRPRPAYLTQRSPSLPLFNSSNMSNMSRLLPPVVPRRQSSFIMNNNSPLPPTSISKQPTRTHSYDNSCIRTSSSGSSSSERRLLVKSGSSESVIQGLELRRRRSHIVVNKQLKRRKSKRKAKQLQYRFRHMNVAAALSAISGLFIMSFALSFFKEHPDLAVVSSLVSTAAPLQKQQPQPPPVSTKLRRTMSQSSRQDQQPQQESVQRTKSPTTNTIAHAGLRGSNDEPTFERFSVNAPTCDTVPEVAFTVVTQLSWNRLWMMEHHCKRWAFSFSIAVFVTEKQSATDVTLELENMGCDVSRIDISVVSGYSETEYPVNVLRNTALSQVKTSHVVYLDVDFWPSVDLYETLQHHLKVLQDPKNALVMPAFQLNRQCPELRECPERNVPKMPHTKSDLLDLMVNHHAASAFDPTNYGGHGSTRYQEWLGQTSDELVEISCVNSNRYEPYLVFRYCRDLPPFQNAFTGYGKNKMTWIVQLRRSGYRLWQLGTSFVVHYPHLNSKARLYWNGGDQGVQLHRPQHIDDENLKRTQVDKTFIKFREWMEENVPDQTVVGKCQHAMNDDTRLWVER